MASVMVQNGVVLRNILAWIRVYRPNVHLDTETTTNAVDTGDVEHVVDCLCLLEQINVDLMPLARWMGYYRKRGVWRSEGEPRSVVFEQTVRANRSHWISHWRTYRETLAKCS